MSYRLEIKETAQKQMKHLDAITFDIIAKRIFALSDDPRPPGVKKLVGDLGWRIRVGEFRVIYAINDKEKLITIVAVKPRQSAYR